MVAGRRDRGGRRGCCRFPHTFTWRAVKAAAVGVFAWSPRGLFDLTTLPPVPERLLVPGVLRWAVVAALTLLVRNASRGSGPLPWPVRLAAWVPWRRGW